MGLILLCLAGFALGLATGDRRAFTWTLALWAAVLLIVVFVTYGLFPYGLAGDGGWWPFAIAFATSLALSACGRWLRRRLSAGATRRDAEI